MKYRFIRVFAEMVLRSHHLNMLYYLYFKA